MSASAIPAIIDALVSAWTDAVPTAAVHDGFGVSADGTPDLMVGIDDPFPDQDPTQAVMSTQVMAALGTQRTREQNGSITCAVYVSDPDTGNSGQKTARTTAYGILETVGDLLRADPTAGVSDFSYLVCQIGQERLSQVKTATSSGVKLVFTINFQARI
jgi:hypothetical protein